MKLSRKTKFLWLFIVKISSLMVFLTLSLETSTNIWATPHYPFYLSGASCRSADADAKTTVIFTHFLTSVKISLLWLWQKGCDHIFELTVIPNIFQWLIILTMLIVVFNIFCRFPRLLLCSYGWSSSLVETNYILAYVYLLISFTLLYIHNRLYLQFGFFLMLY